MKERIERRGMPMPPLFEVKLQNLTAEVDGIAESLQQSSNDEDVLRSLDGRITAARHEKESLERQWMADKNLDRQGIGTPSGRSEEEEQALRSLTTRLVELSTEQQDYLDFAYNQKKAREGKV